MRKGRLQPRIQTGTIHVYIRGNSRYNVFYDDLERTEFLKQCQRSANQHDTTITEFTLMDNHAHLQIETENLSRFMKSLLQGYVQWYNRKNGLRDKLFKSPFNSSCKFSTERIIDNKLYILQNSMEEEMCDHPSDYKWSSYKFHFGQKTKLSKYILVNTNPIDKYYKTIVAFNNAILEKAKSSRKNERHNSDTYERISDSEVAKYALRIIAPKNIFQLNRDEVRALIVRLKRETNASYRQISSLTHENYDYVRKLCATSPLP